MGLWLACSLLYPMALIRGSKMESHILKFWRPDIHTCPINKMWWAKMCLLVPIQCPWPVSWRLYWANICERCNSRDHCGPGATLHRWPLPVFGFLSDCPGPLQPHLPSAPTPAHPWSAWVAVLLQTSASQCQQPPLCWFECCGAQEPISRASDLPGCTVTLR